MEHITICIGRQYGSGGREVGERLAQRLKIPCYDKTLVKAAAEESGLSFERIQHAEEKLANNCWVLSGNPFADSAAIAHAFYSESQLAFDAEKDVIEHLAQQGPCVMIGRCSSAILPRQRCLSVFIYADEPSRVKRVMDRNRLDEKTAAQRLRHVDRLRRQYFDFYANTQWGKPESYDLMISSDRFGIEGCVEQILVGLKSSKGGESHE